MLDPWPPGGGGDAEVWVHRAPLRFYGLEFGTRMTVVRLAGGGLLVHSPTALDGALMAAIDRIGPVRWVLSPNKLHHLYLAGFASAYPEARLFAPPGLAAKRPDIAFAGALGDAPEPAWADRIDQAVFAGSRAMQEVVFLHKPTRTLIVGDLVEHFRAEDAPLTRLAARIAGMYGKPAMPPDWRLTVRDRDAARRSIKRILAWDFDRIVLAHGRLVERGGKALFRRAFAWLMKRAERARLTG